MTTSGTGPTITATKGTETSTPTTATRKREQEHHQAQLDRYYEEQTAAQSVERRKATEESIRIAEEESKTQRAAERSLRHQRKI